MDNTGELATLTPVPILNLLEPKHLPRTLVLLAFLLGVLPGLFAQPDTEIFLFSLDPQDAANGLDIPHNVSMNPGYDNQPSFIPENKILLYTRTRNGQTDLVTYDPESGHFGWVTNTPVGSEYSPQWIPGTQSISAIRLDTTGLQRLYAYTLEDDSSSGALLFDDLKIGYTSWIDEDRVLCTVLREDRMDLGIASRASATFSQVREGVGRCLLPIPGERRWSYTAAVEGALWVHALDPDSGTTEPLMALPEGVQDYCWLPEGSLVCGGTDGLWKGSNGTWEPWKNFGEGFGHITRLAVDSRGHYMALVVEKTATP